MIRLITITFAVLGFGLLAVPVNAGTINFANYASVNEGGVKQFNALSFGTDDNLQFISGQIAGQSGDGLPDGLFYSYFNSGENGAAAGLGVCRVLAGAPGIFLPGAKCDEAGEGIVDGALGINEVVGFTINHHTDGYRLQALSFLGADSNDLKNSAGRLTIQWRAFGSATNSIRSMTFAEAVAMATAGEFGVIEYISFSYVDTAFVLASISDVPIPGAIPFMLSGLAGLGVFSRNRKGAKRIL